MPATFPPKDSSDWQCMSSAVNSSTFSGLALSSARPADEEKTQPAAGDQYQAKWKGEASTPNRPRHGASRCTGIVERTRLDSISIAVRYHPRHCAERPCTQPV